MKLIALDVMGGDLGPVEAVKGAVRFVKENANYKVILVGDEAQIKPHLSKDVASQLEIFHVAKEVSKSSSSFAAREIDNSMSYAINLVAEQKADAIISSGNSAALLTYATVILKRIEGVKRPAFAPLFPTIKPNQRFVLLDAGANLEVTSEMLVQWALLGSAFARVVLNIPKPSVALLNIGVEDDKGLLPAREAHQVLKKEPRIDYRGFIEPRELISHVIDVAIVDGYGGNMVLKSYEGAASGILKALKGVFMNSFLTKLAALLIKKPLTQLRKTTDYRTAGAAWILGLNGLAAKCHGSSDQLAFYQALNLVKIAIENNALSELKKAVHDLA